MVLVHGGAWSSGSKMVMGRYGNRLAGDGCVVMAINYRLAPDHKFPAQVDDVRDALVWIAQNAGRYHIDTDRIGMFGYSAGGHLCCMIATLEDEDFVTVQPTTQWPSDDPRWAKMPAIAAVVAGGPPCEFRTLPPLNTGLAYFLGGSRTDVPGVYDAASPVAFASSGDCEICFIHGEKDFIVPLDSSRGLYDAQVAAGVASEFNTIDNQGHMITFVHPKTVEILMGYVKRKLTE